MQLKPFEPSLNFVYPFGPSTYTVALSATGGPADRASAICTSVGVWASIVRTAASAEPSTGPDSKRLSATNGNDSIDAPPWQAVAPMSVGRPPEGCTWRLDDCEGLGVQRRPRFSKRAESKKYSVLTPSLLARKARGGPHPHAASD